MPKLYIAKFCVAKLAIVILFATVSCKSEQREPEPEPEIVVDTAVRDAALLLGGVALPSGSALAEHIERNSQNGNAEYRAWAANIDSLWERTQALNLSLIEDWRKATLTNDYPKTVFSPFSGPDILNALAFFPDGNEFILFGQQPAGRVPRPEELTPARLMLELRHMQNALSDILALNFFQTIHMNEQVGEDSCASFAGIIMFFLTRMNMEVVAARNISIDTNGAIIDNYDPKNSSLVPGVEFEFRARIAEESIPIPEDGGGAETGEAANGGGAKTGVTAAPKRELKRVRYFSLDISDDGLAANDNFEKFAETFPPCSTFIKSASFLMHKDFFSRIRTMVLDKSAFVLQDDSGVPLRFFLNEDWNVDYYGYYERPIPLFSNYFQRELLTNMRAHSSGRLPFSYGYNAAKGSSYLILAERVRILILMKL